MTTTRRVLFGALALAGLLTAAVGGYLLAGRTDPSRDARSRPASSRQALVSAPHLEPVAVDKKGGPDPVATSPAPNPAPTRRVDNPVRQQTVRTTTTEARPTPPPAKNDPATQATDRGLPTLNTGLSSAPAAAAFPVVAPADSLVPPPHADEHTPLEPLRPEPAPKTTEELVVPADSVIGLQADMPVSSERARVEDRVDAHVTRDVRVRDMVAVPAGARALGSVILVERGNKFKDRARIGIRFHTLVLADGTRLLVSTETIYRDGNTPSNESAAKIGGATVAGTILGAIVGGGKGAGIGAGAGAAAGTGAVLAGDRSAAVLRAGEPMTVRILSPFSITVDK